MAKKNNRKCICCSKEYRYCNTCAEDIMKPAWYAIYHNENCKNIFHAVSDYLAKEITEKQAKEILEKCDLSDKKKFKSKISKTIDEIMVEEKSETKKVETVKKTVTKETVKEENK